MIKSFFVYLAIFALGFTLAVGLFKDGYVKYQYRLDWRMSFHDSRKDCLVFMNRGENSHGYYVTEFFCIKNGLK